MPHRIWSTKSGRLKLVVSAPCHLCRRLFYGFINILLFFILCTTLLLFQKVRSFVHFNITTRASCESTIFPPLATCSPVSKSDTLMYVRLSQQCIGFVMRTNSFETIPKAPKTHAMCLQLKSMGPLSPFLVAWGFYRWIR